MNMVTVYWLNTTVQTYRSASVAGDCYSIVAGLLPEHVSGNWKKRDILVHREKRACVGEPLCVLKCLLSSAHLCSVLLTETSDMCCRMSPVWFPPALYTYTH